MIASLLMWLYIMNYLTKTNKKMKTTIIFKDIEFKVDYYYQPEEKAEWYEAGGGYARVPANVELESIELKGIELMEIFSESDVEEIENQILEEILGRDENDY